MVQLLDALEKPGQIILAGPPGTGKTWVAEAVARYLTQDEPYRKRLVQFHPSYGYEDFVEGLRPIVKDGVIVFDVVPGVVLAMVKNMTEGETRVLIIDEMNRANIPRVFGELLYLLEYRDESIGLQYSRDFSLPVDLKFIGTMNTADRSIRSIDVALRRRFELFECPPDPAILRRFYESGDRVNTVPELAEGFAKLNADLSAELDRHHTIGQSFFMDEEFTPTLLRRRWQRQIAPLLEDYFFDQPDLIGTFTTEKYWPGI